MTTASASWPAEDGGPTRRQIVPGPGPATALASGASMTAIHRDLLGSNMVVTDTTGSVFVQGNTLGGDETTAWVERIDPETLQPLARSMDLPGGPYWAGGIVCHDNGSLYVTYSRWCHRLDADTLEVIAATELPAPRPYNSLIVLPSGHLVMKDFDLTATVGCTLSVLEPDTLTIVADATLPEASIARLSALDDDVYVVGAWSAFRLQWEVTDRSLTVDDTFTTRYRTLDGQTYGWDAVLADGSMWFLDNGEGSERFAGTFRGRGISAAPLHLVRLPLDRPGCTLTEICGRPDGLIANPPIIDPSRGIAVGYDSANGIVTAFDYSPASPEEPLSRRWQIDQNHASHMLYWPEDGSLLTFDHQPEAGDQAVILDVGTGRELGRVATGSPVQTVLFPAPGPSGCVYVCSHTTLTRLTISPL